MMRRKNTTLTFKLFQYFSEIFEKCQKREEKNKKKLPENRNILLIFTTSSLKFLNKTMLAKKKLRKLRFLIG